MDIKPWVMCVLLPGKINLHYGVYVVIFKAMLFLFSPQLMGSRKPEEVTPAAIKPHRKSHSYSGLGTASPLNRQLSPHHGSQSNASPNYMSNGSKHSPNYAKTSDEQYLSNYGKISVVY